MRPEALDFTETELYIDEGKSRFPVPTTLIIYACIFTGIYLTSFGGYLFFHAVSEIFSLVIACGVFILAWNSRRYMKNDYFLFIGIAYLFVGSMDFLHTISYKGMGVFPNLSSNVAIQLWVAARYLEAISLLAGLLFISRKLNRILAIAAFGLVFAFIVLSIYRWGVFPDCFVDGQGLTTFKVVSEYVVCGILAVTFVLMISKREKFAPNVLAYFLAAIGITIFAELVFTLYSTLFGWMNFAGHLLKIVSFLFIYHAVIVTGFEQPFNFMFRELKQKEKIINDDREKLKKIIENLPAGAIHMDSEGCYANPLFLSITGAETSVFKDANSVKKFLGIDRDRVGLKASDNPVQSCLNEGTEQERIVEVALHRYGEGEVILIIDVTEKRRRENEREALLAALERKNKEIEVFTYGISHDLKSPLVTIEGFSDMLKDEIGEHMTEDIERYLQTISRSSAKMRIMIEDLLEFSRMGATKEEPVTVELSAVIKEVIDSLSGRVRETGASIEVSNADMEITVMQSQVVRVFENLISNALKYGGKEGTAPEVMIGVEERGGRRTIFVSDNGPGIPTQYCEKIFDIFYRCPQARKIEGTGVGLAMVKKIVENHGGEITVDCPQDHGCKFNFTLS